MNIKHKI